MPRDNTTEQAPTLDAMFMLFPKASEPAAQRIAAFWQSQERILEAMDEFTVGWLARRHDGAKAASSAALSMCAARTPMALFSAQQEWATGALQRLFADNAAAQREWMRVCSAMTSTATPSESDSQTHEQHASPTTPSRRAKAA
jgi:hypothetical protein